MHQADTNSRRAGVAGLLAAMGYLLIGLFVAQSLSLLVVRLLFGLSTAQLVELLSEPQQVAQGRLIVLVLQCFVALFAFVIAPLLVLVRQGATSPQQVYGTASPRSLGLALLAWLCSLPVVQVLSTWNQSLDLSQALPQFWAWAAAKEAELEQLTLFLIGVQSPSEWLAALLAIAVLPALGEELLFRRVLQPQAIAATGSSHVGIVLTAVLFSAIHLQFLGFFPRFALGLLLGYVYYYSGSLWPVILIHFANNAGTLLVLKAAGVVNLNENPMPDGIALVLAAPALVGCIFLVVLLARINLHSRAT